MSTAAAAAADRDAIRARLEETLGPVHHSDLAAHLARDAVFLVAAGTPLVACGVAIATDDARAVSAWLSAGVLRRPTADERAAWAAAPAERTWNAVVVQPFVLVQDPA